MKAALFAIAAAALAASATITPAVAQTAPAPAAKAKISFASTKISDLIKDAKAKKILETALPPIVDYYDQIGDMTLTDVAPQAQGMLDDDKIKAMQAEYDKG